MKVCTDACLFGSYIANKLVQISNETTNVLDIGAGTGLLSLMLSQKVNAHIDAVEIDASAYVQAKSNIEAASIGNKITLFQNDILDFDNHKKYDIIISNPPFFENQLKSDNDHRNAAMHATTLSFVDLIRKISQLLSPNGNAYLLLPYYAVPDFEKLLEQQNLFVTEQLNVKHNPAKPFFRAMIEIGFEKKQKVENEISINNADGAYSNEFIFLLKDYYLKL
jgi:tRNA1Val (adenine37-N6)-methyltransferase